MSATVAAALKKIAVWLLTNKKVMKTVLGIVLGVILIIVMPIVAILGIFSGGVEIDTGRLHEMIAEQQTVSAERWAEVENAMKSAGYDVFVKDDPASPEWIFYNSLSEPVSLKETDMLRVLDRTAAEHGLSYTESCFDRLDGKSMKKEKPAL